MNVILLSAGVGKRLAPYTEIRPKCLMDVQGITLLERHLVHCARNGADRITVVVGHLSEMIEAEIARVAPTLSPKVEVRTVMNERYRLGSIVSLQRGLEKVDDDVIFMDTDVLYDPRVLERLFGSKNESCLLIDATSKESGEEMMVGANGGRARAIARRVSPLGTFEVSGESVGFFRVGRDHLRELRGAIEETIREKGENNEYEEALNRLFGSVSVGFERVDDLAWTEIDFAEDLRHAREDVAPGLPSLYPEERANVGS
jgi:choline kinase